MKFIPKQPQNLTLIIFEDTGLIATDKNIVHKGKMAQIVLPVLPSRPGQSDEFCLQSTAQAAEIKLSKGCSHPGSSLWA